MTKEDYAQMLEAMWKRTVAELQNAEDSRIFLDEILGTMCTGERNDDRRT